MSRKSSFQVLGALLVLLLVIEACRNQPRAVVPSGQLNLSNSRRAASGANIVVVPSSEGAGKLPSFRFCFEGDKNYDPQIWRVHLGPVSGQKGVCEIVATGDAWLWGEWKVGSLPSGFRMVGCDVLAPGQYEVYVDALVGSGIMRMQLDADGVVKRLPWDELDSRMGKDCPPSGRQRPSLYPRQEPPRDGDNGLVSAEDLESMRAKRPRHDAGTKTQP